MKNLGSLLQIPPKSVSTESLYLVGLVTVAAVVHMISMLLRVGSARHKYKVVAPAIDGDPRFVLIYRAHQNCVENFPLFLAALWTAAMFFNQVPAAILGVCYIVSREIYFSAYSAKADKRGPGFLLSILAVFGLVIVAALGCAGVGYRAYRGYDIFKMWLHHIPIPFF